MRSTISAVLFLALGCGGQMAAPSSSVDRGEVPNVPTKDAEAPQTNVQAGVRARKIIYEAELHLVVEDLAIAEQAVIRLVQQHGGYLADGNVERRQGTQLTGHWVAQIPVDQYDPFLEAAAKLGVPERRKQRREDVTEQYLDLEAQIANKKRLEERIQELLQKPGELKDLIEVERELARVRGEVEQLEGRLKFLQNRTSFTTITITAVEQRNYIPPQAPTFISRIQSTFQASLETLLQFGQGLAIFVVAVLPWLIVLGSVLLFTFFLVRLLIRMWH